MANTDTPKGLVPIRHRNGAPYNGGGSLYHIDSADVNAFAAGDPVVVSGTADANGVPTVTLATAGATNRITGVLMGQVANASSTLLQSDSTTIPATKSKDYYVLVEDNPDVVFEAQATTIAATDVSSNADLQAGAANSLGFSGWEVNGGTYGTGATLQVKVLRVVQRENNEIGANAKVEVMLNLPTQAADVAGV